MRYLTRRSVPPPNPFLRTNRRVRTRGGGTNRSTRSTQELVSLRERQLQEVWGEALNREEVERNILGTVMDDILQKAMEEAIPEIVVEARSEMEQIVQQGAAIILEEVTAATVAATASTPAVEVVNEPREGAPAPSQRASVAEDTLSSVVIATPEVSNIPVGSQNVHHETAVAEETISSPRIVQIQTHQDEETTGEGGPAGVREDSEPLQSVEIVGETDERPVPGTSGVVQLQVESISGLEQHQAQVHQSSGEGDSSGDTDGSDWSDRLIQGDIAPELSVSVQKNLKRAGVFLVIATNVVNDLWTTQLVDGTLTLKEQRDIRSNKGEILITQDPDTYRVASMNLDVEWLQHQVRMREEEQTRLQRIESQGVTGPTNVAIRDSKEIEVQETPQAEEGGQETSDEDYDPEQETGDESSEGEEQPLEEGQGETSGIGEILGEPSEESSAKESTMGSPRVPKPKRKRKHSRVVEEEDTTEESEDSVRRRKTPSGKNLAAMKRQMSQESGKNLQIPKTVGFKESLYRREHGSTRVWGGKGRGKSGQKRKKATPKKKKAGPIPIAGWQDPEVERAKRNEPPRGALPKEDPCRKKYGGRMINTTQRGKKQNLKGEPKNPF